MILYLFIHRVGSSNHPFVVDFLLKWARFQQIFRFSIPKPKTGSFVLRAGRKKWLEQSWLFTDITVSSFPASKFRNFNFFQCFPLLLSFYCGGESVSCSDIFSQNLESWFGWALEEILQKIKMYFRTSIEVFLKALCVYPVRLLFFLYAAFLRVLLEELFSSEACFRWIIDNFLSTNTWLQFYKICHVSVDTGFRNWTKLTR